MRSRASAPAPSKPPGALIPSFRSAVRDSPTTRAAVVSLLFLTAHPQMCGQGPAVRLAADGPWRGATAQGPRRPPASRFVS